MASVEALGPPHTTRTESASDRCAERVVQASEMLNAEKYEVALCLLLGDEGNDQETGLADALSRREHLGMVAGTLGAAVPAMVAEVCANLPTAVSQICFSKHKSTN